MSKLWYEVEKVEGLEEEVLIRFPTCNLEGVKSVVKQFLLIRHEFVKNRNSSVLEHLKAEEHIKDMLQKEQDCISTGSKEDGIEVLAIELRGFNKTLSEGIFRFKAAIETDKSTVGVVDGVIYAKEREIVDIEFKVKRNELIEVCAECGKVKKSVICYDCGTNKFKSVRFQGISDYVVEIIK